MSEGINFGTSDDEVNVRIWHGTASTWVPIGTFFRFRVPIFPILGFRAREKSVQPLFNCQPFDYL